MDRTTSGFDSITSIPAGAVVKQVYWTVANQFGYVGDPHDSQADVLETAIADRTRLLKSLKPGDFRPDRIDIQMRWEVAYPQGHDIGGSVDLAVHAVTYNTLADAVEHHALLRRWAQHAI
jgi:hypothetical protein